MTMSTLGIDKQGACWDVQMLKTSTADMQVAMFYVFPHGQTQKDIQPIGNASLGIEENKAKFDIKIDEEFQDRHIGTLLMMFLENWSLKHGVKTIYGEISNVDADHFKTLRHFYTKLGFKFDLWDASKTRGIIVGHTEKVIQK
jgi:GNAT superfamily N-acetyltransferase